MTWQESLRQLDLRLTKGEIGAAEYRRVRDEILAEASSGSAAAGKQTRQDLWAAAQQKAARDEEAAAAAETTLVVRLNPEEEEDATDEEATQVVTADQLQVPPPPVGPPPSAPPSAPPLPPPSLPPGQPAGPAYRAAPIQGQEVFAEAGPERGPRPARFLVPLLVLALVGAGVWWLASRGEDTTGAVTGDPAAGTTGQPVPDSERIAGLLPDLPGKANANNGTMSVDRARQLELFTPTYATLLADNGASEIVYRGAVNREFGYLLVASPIPPANGARGVAVLASEHLLRAGFGPAAELSPADPAVITRVDDVFRTFIAIYSSGDVWVQFNVSGAPDGDEAALRAEFQRILATLTRRLPAD